MEDPPGVHCATPADASGIVASESDRMRLADKDDSACKIEADATDNG